MKPKVLIFTGMGLNCDTETRYAFERAGAICHYGHINDIIDQKEKIRNYQILVFQGGFSYGDDTGSGNAYALRIRNHLFDELIRFIRRDNLVIGICNGFQILVNLGLIPATEGVFGKREVALTSNDNCRYTVRWVDLAVKNKSPWLAGLTGFSLPIAHGEGKLIAPNTVLKKMKKKNMIALEYTAGEICKWYKMEANPNGSSMNIAGITDESGRILGLMPHPERAQFFHHLPNWTYLKEFYQRTGKELPVNGPGFVIFQNAIKYFH